MLSAKPEFPKIYLRKIPFQEKKWKIFNEQYVFFGMSMCRNYND